MVYDAPANPQPQQRVLKESTVLGMVDMMHTVVEAGTGRRARLPGINVAGKTGTTNAYRDAWFVGYTGNFTTAVWLGNDNYQPTNRLTGGVLPAATWAKYMRVAMAYETPIPLPGLPPPADTGEQLVADTGTAAARSIPALPAGSPPRPQPRSAASKSASRRRRKRRSAKRA